MKMICMVLTFILCMGCTAFAQFSGSVVVEGDGVAFSGGRALGDGTSDFTCDVHLLSSRIKNCTNASCSLPQASPSVNAAWKISRPQPGVVIECIQSGACQNNATYQCDEVL